MNGAFLHLAFNHIPVIGVPFCALLLLGGMIRKSKDLVQASFAMLILTALLTIVAFKTGGPAARIVHSYPGVTRAQIHEHAEAADDAFKAMDVLGILAIIGFWLSRRPEGAPKALTGVILLGALFMSCWFGWVAHLGGEIRHPEIESASEAAAPAPAANPPAH